MTRKPYTRLFCCYCPSTSEQQISERFPYTKLMCENNVRGACVMDYLSVWINFLTCSGFQLV